MRECPREHAPDVVGHSPSKVRPFAYAPGMRVHLPFRSHRRVRRMVTDRRQLDAGPVERRSASEPERTSRR